MLSCSFRILSSWNFGGEEGCYLSTPKELLASRPSYKNNSKHTTIRLKVLHKAEQHYPKYGPTGPRIGSSL